MAARATRSSRRRGGRAREWRRWPSGCATRSRTKHTRTSTERALGSAGALPNARSGVQVVDEHERLLPEHHRLERAEHCRVEEAGDLAAEQLERVLRGERIAVGAAGGQRVE